MTCLIEMARKLRAEEDAATTAEYILLAMLIAVACVAAATTFGSSVLGEYQKAVDGFS